MVYGNSYAPYASLLDTGQLRCIYSNIAIGSFGKVIGKCLLLIGKCSLLIGKCLLLISKCPLLTAGELGVALYIAIGSFGKVRHIPYCLSYCLPQVSSGWRCI